VQSPLLFCGNSNPQLAEEIAKRLRLHVGKALVSEFRNEETRVEIGENVRGSEVFVVQSICKTANGKGVNDAVMELLLMIDALRRASAARITAVIPYYGYAKQDKKTKGREPISAKVIANLLKVTGARRIVTMDLHAAQIQGFFDIPVDNLMAMPVLCNYLKTTGKSRPPLSAAKLSSSVPPPPASAISSPLPMAAPTILVSKSTLTLSTTCCTEISSSAARSSSCSTQL